MPYSDSMSAADTTRAASPDVGVGLLRRYPA